MSSNPSEGNSSSTGSSQADSRQPSGQSLFSWAANRSSSSGPQKIRVTILCARSLVKRDLFRLPDPFVKVHVDGSGQSHVTEAGKNTLDPKWNVHYDLYVGSNDAITISVWNDKKVGIKSLFYPHYDLKWVHSISISHFSIRSTKEAGELVSWDVFDYSIVQSID